MRKIILGLAVSLDGLIEGPLGEYDWCFTDQDYGMTPFIQRIDAILMGRKSYEMMKAYDGPNPWSGVHTLVFSNTLTEGGTDATIISGDVVTKTAKLKHAQGKDMWCLAAHRLPQL